MKRKTDYAKWIARVYGKRFYYLSAQECYALKRGFIAGFRACQRKGRKRLADDNF